MNLKEFFERGIRLTDLFSENTDYLPMPLRKMFQEQENHFPWSILGAPLKEAIRASVAQIPAHSRIKGQIHPGAWLFGDEIVVEEGASIEAGAYIEGPTYIAKGAVIRHGAYIRGYVYVGPGAIIGHTTEAKETILLKDAKAAHFAYLGNSVLGASVNLGAGTKLANLRIDHRTVKIRSPQGKIETNLKKFGALLGDHAQTGCNSVTNPGTIVLARAVVMPCQNVSGFIDIRS